MQLSAERIKTTRTNLRPAQPAAADAISICRDKIADIVRLCGYEKTLSANRETIFVENLSDSIISRIFLSISYRDTSDREIHRRQTSLTYDIPPRSTRRFDIPSWDKQKSYYYIKGVTPRRAATPYDISITCDSLIIIPAYASH